MRFVKGLANSTLTYVPNMIRICPKKIKNYDWGGMAYATLLHFMI